ncbi:Immunoglobulin domain [Popillia japonica]|uniref:Immunoglobulin domain n=1 Tax=Popillia japonica TaxID=7064 RepID=A0AAW1LTF9_POPJA
MSGMNWTVVFKSIQQYQELMNRICDLCWKFGCQCFPGYSGTSCSEGPKSGCTNSDGSPLCQNGAFCRHIGDSFIKCECPEGYTGEYCNSSAKSEDEETKLVSCMVHELHKQPCECQQNENISTNDLYAYTGVVQVKNFPVLEGTNIKTYISNEIMTNLQLNTSAIKHLHIIDLESSQTEYEVTFRFYGSNSHENHLRSVINKWGEIGYIGNMTVVNPDIAFYKESIILSIQTIRVTPGRIIHEGDDFILSCSAQGSPNMSFRWYKDGMFVNITQFKNNKWVTLRKGSSLTNYLAILTVDKATALDGGLFTCQVEDFNIQQCLSKRVEIRSRPTVVLDTMSLTVSKGESFSIKCSSYNSAGSSIYSWTKNGNLIPTKTKRERYDTLYLTGSLLRVSGLSKSANYSCLVQDRTTKSETSVSVIVKQLLVTIAFKTVHNPGYDSIQNCPQGYTGVAKRLCILLDGSNPQWDKPDMSDCVSTNMGVIIRDVSDGQFLLNRYIFYEIIKSIKQSENSTHTDYRNVFFLEVEVRKPCLFENTMIM